MNPRHILALVPIALAGSIGPVLAHHPMGGETPGTLATGLLSGLGHPIIGVDHLAFVIAVGLAAAFTGHRLLSPLAFVAATVAGCLLQVAGTVLPAAEFVIAASILLLGGIVLSGRRIASPALLGLFAVAGLFHGWAYGESIVGAEPTPLVAYLAGFSLIQYAIAAGSGYLVLRVWNAADRHAIHPRLAGAVIAGIGLTFLIENLEGLLLA
ncbi:MAG: HupE/UreJ family protein [Thalassobaculum sp.]|uniref:HupE/UreJ family protein n=1 Tax=Thalassobaculum sp. TaxID=2022740 RepID=UPI0032EBA715